MTLTLFTLNDRVNLQQVLSLPPCEIREGSDLYCRLERIESRDQELGIDKTGFVQGLITDYLEINTKIKEARSKTEYGVKSVDTQQISFENFDQRSPDQGLIKQREEIVYQLKNELGYLSVSPYGLIPVDGVFAEPEFIEYLP